MRCLIWALFLTFFCHSWAPAQTLKVRPAGPAQPTNSDSAPTPSPSIPLTVPAGTPLKVAVQEVRVRKVGQSVHGKVTEPVYAFDRLVVPAGSEINGKIAEIETVSKKKRAMAALNANFSPSRGLHIEFDDLVLADGRHLPVQTSVAHGSSGVLQFVPAGAENGGAEKKGEAVKNLASRKVSEARQEVKRDWESVKQQLHEPGKMHRIERYGIDQLPYHPQYIDAGTSFNADLQQPLEFGAEPLKLETLSGIGTPPPAGSVVHALLTTPLNSAASKKGDPVEAVVSQPLVVSDHLFLPQGSHIKGAVLQSRPARRLGRNGQLRIVFHEVVPPNGVQQKASLEGVAVAKGEHLSLDSEGGAQVTTPRTRYLTTAITVMLASSTAGDHDRDAGVHGADGGGVGQGAANGASGFRLVGTMVGAFAHSRIVSSGFGFYGAGMSVYSHFLARGHDVNYPKDMSMLIGLGTRGPSPAGTPAVPKGPGSHPNKPK
jgi:hypothetical protein